jgi:Domain of unknown function (DUF4440)
MQFGSLRGFERRQKMNYRQQWFTAALATFVLSGGIFIHSFMAKSVLASTGDDDVRTLTQIAMNESRITGVNPESLAVEERRLADTVTIVTLTGLVKYVQKDAILAHLRKETGDARLSIEVSDVQVHLYGDTAVVTYQKQMKQFTSSEGTPAMARPLIGHPISFMDTFVKRNGEWNAVATVGVSQSPVPDELYKAVETGAAQW